MNRLKTILVFVALVFCTTGWAQKSKGVVAEVMFPIDSVYTARDSFFVVVKADKLFGIEKGLFARAYTRWRPATQGDAGADLQQVGFGWVIAIKQGKAICAIDHEKGVKKVAKNDLLSFNLETPLVSQRSVFSSLTFNNILFTDAESKPLYSLKGLWMRDSRAIEDSLVNVIIADVKYTYDYVKDMEGMDDLRKPLTGGRFNGRSVFDIMRDADRNAVLGYLLFVKSFPGKYIGSIYKANETFATWVLNNAPYTSDEVKAALFPIYTDQQKLSALLPVYARNIKSSGMVEGFADEAINQFNAFNKAGADSLLHFAKTLAYALDDTAGKAAYYVKDAEIVQNDGRYEEAIAKCDTALQYAVAAGKKELELRALMKKAFCQYKASHFAEGKATLAQADKKIAGYKSTISTSDYNLLLQKRYEYEGWIQYGEGSYDAALTAFNQAIVINNTINSFESREKNAGYYSFIAGVYNDQGKHDKALEAYKQSAAFYTGIRDEYNSTKLLNSIGYTQYKQGAYRQSVSTLTKAYTALQKQGDWDNAGYSKSVVGSNYWELGKYDSAVLAHKEAIALRRKSNNTAGQAFSWKQMGDLYQLSGLKQQALTAFDSAGRLYQSTNDLSGLGDTYLKVGEVFYNDENYYKAAQQYEQALSIATKTTVEALYNLGNAWSEIDAAKAKAYYLKCKQTADSTGNTNYSFFAAKALAGTAYREHKFEDGDRYLSTCAAVGRQLSTPLIDAYTLSLRGQRWYNLSQLDSTLKYYQAAAGIYDTVSKSDYIWQLWSIADLYISKGEFAQAEKVLNEAVKLSRATTNNLALGSSLQKLTFLYALLGDFEKGFKASDSAIAIFKKSGNLLRLADSYGARGNVYEGMGNYKKSIEAMLFADSVYTAEKTIEYRSVVLGNIGVTYFQQADYPKAIDYFNQALALRRGNAVNEDLLLMRANVAEALYYFKKPAEAEAIYTEVYPEAKKRNLNRISSGMAIVLGRMAADKSDWSKATAFFDEAYQYSLASNERSKLIESLTQLGKVQARQGESAKAAKSFAEAIGVAKANGIAGGWEAYYEAGVMLFNQQKFDSSISYFRTAVELLNKYTQNVYGGKEAQKVFNNDPRKADLYFKLSFAYGKIGKPEQSFGFANLSNLAGLKELSGQQAVPGYAAETKKLEDLQQKAAALRQSAEKGSGENKIAIVKQLQVAEKEYTNYLLSLVQKDEKFNTYYPQEANPNSFLKYKGELPDDVAVVLYLLNNNNLMAFTLTNEALSIQVDSLGKEMAQTVKAFVQLAKRPEKGSGTGALRLRAEATDEEDIATTASFADVSSTLYQLLIANVYPKISSKKRLCVIPNGLLSDLPFQCLGQKDKDGRFRFLAEDHAVFYTNDIGIFYKSRKLVPEKADIHSFAAFGVPDQTLRYNTKEVKEIGDIIGATNAVYADSRATEGMAKTSLTQKRFVHFATHGILNHSMDFSKSYLKFLPDKDTASGNNGKLTIPEIQELSIDDCDLVTLSACETAVNKQVASGWNISPANAFLLRRVKSVVASLWKVDDEATSLLMNEFYSNLAKKIDKVDALRLAQVKLSQNPKYSHPFYWGAFVLYGEWR